MMKEYFEARHPAHDGRKNLPQDEVVAHLAARLIRGEDNLIWHAKSQGLQVPAANKSARIESRQRAGMGEWVKVRGSAAFFVEVAAFAAELAAAGFDVA